MRLSQYILTPIFLIISSISLAMEPPETKYFMVTDQCCGEDSDPHAVHGIAVEENGYILSGKSVDNEESHDGFVVKFPYLKNEEGNIWLHPEDDFNIEWTYIFGSDGKLDAANASASLDGFVFVAGHLSSKEGVVNRYLAKLDLSDGSLIWEMSYPSAKKNKDSSFVSASITRDNGLILTGVTNAKSESLEGFKSYGNPYSGNTFLMYFNEGQLKADNAPENPSWETEIGNSMIGLAIEESHDEQAYVIAAATSEKKGATPMIIKIDQEGNQIWSKKYSDHGEVTDIAISTINGEVDGYLITGHNGGEKGGIDAIITKVSMDGSILWDELYGNPSGGDSIFADLGRGNEKIIYDECWGIESMNDGGAVIACGTGTHCYEHKRNKKLFAQCEEDPRGTWRALLVRVDKDGNLLWERADSFLEEEEEDWIPDTASEYVTLTSSKNIVSILDLGFGYGIQVLESE